MKRIIPLCILVLALLSTGISMRKVSACRIIVPPPWPPHPPHPPFPPRPRPIHLPNRELETRRHTAEVNIKGPIARVAVDAVFYNPNSRVLEGTYFFPLPAEAAVDNFEMKINGKMVKGELLEAEKARGIYEGIVRKMKDPGLLEFFGTKMLKCRVYPMNPCSETVVKLNYSLVLKNNAGLYEFIYPLRSAKPGSGKIKTCALRVKIEQEDGIKTVYSPTHQVDINRKGESEVSLGFEKSDLVPERDFKLYFSVSNKDIGLSVLSFKPASEDGYFLLSVSPKVEVEEKKVQAKSIIFVMDTSGSMAGEKMRQAKGSLRFCLNSLRANDRFAIIPFATEAMPYSEELLPASRDNISNALDFCEKLNARGGTAIDEALNLALKTIKGAESLAMIVFLTDGMPTIGEVDIKTILKNVKNNNGEKARLFVFGVGYDVNTELLDILATESRGTSDYVSPKENIEVKVSNFFQKISSPVLSDLVLNISNLRTYDRYPKKLPDLFRGNQLMIVGRFKGQGGHHAIKLSGKVAAKQKEFVFESNFDSMKANDFLPRQWATRKVAYLLDEIRLHGKNRELVDEVVKLGKRYGIMTPYTSFLVVEDSPVAMRRPMLRRRMEEARSSFDMDTAGRGAVQRAKQLGAAKRAPMAPAPSSGYYNFGFDDEAKESLREIASKQIVQIEDKTFYLKRDGFLYDSLYDETLHRGGLVQIKAFSEHYFELLREHQGIGRFLAEKKKMVIVFGNKAYKISYPD
ncbi:VIT domain-containing protein [Candidatus Riflebacteria bacterium]